MMNLNIALLSVSFFLFTSTCRLSLADNNSLQDTCPSSDTPGFVVNGLPCKNPAHVTSNDFTSSVLNQTLETDSFYKSTVKLVTATEFSGLNTLGLSIARTDLDVDGLVTPHSHPRSSEMMFVSQGVAIVGFVDTNNAGFQRVLKKGDVFVVPRGLLHYCFNGGFERVTMFSVLNSQNPGVVSVLDSVLGSEDQQTAKSFTMRLAAKHGNGEDGNWNGNSLEAQDRSGVSLDSSSSLISSMGFDSVFSHSEQPKAIIRVNDAMMMPKPLQSKGALLDKNNEVKGLIKIGDSKLAIA